MALQTFDNPAAAAAWLQARLAAGGGTLVADSRRLRAGDAFLAVPGATVDARRFVPAALAAGAVACLVEAEGAEGLAPDDARVATLPGLKAAAGDIAHRVFGRPSEALTVIASTGTNGKTSTSWWTAQALTAAGRRAGVIGTLGVGEPGGTIESTGLTTPDPVMLQAALAAFHAQGLKACAMEASSIGLAEERLAGTVIHIALFTNLTQDHLDHHGSMQAYGEAKQRLFRWPGLRAAVINVDDAFGRNLAAELSGTALDLWTVSLHGGARLVAGPRGYDERGLVFEVHERGAAGPGAHSATLRLAVVGEFNASNALVVLGALRAAGLPLAEAAAAMAALAPVPGRLERVSGAGDAIEAVVDYAHTPDALAQVLAALRPLATARGGRLVCVFGCGGDRDPTKRAPMGAMAAQGADRVIVTSDNPRSESPGTIVAQVLAGAAGAAHVRGIVDRREAIRTAFAEAAPGDVVLVAGKGHETTQTIAGVALPFDDRDEARAALALCRPAGALA
jgi:UDP-N-acetylmuramyl-tripeptide synthetase